MRNLLIFFFLLSGFTSIAQTIIQDTGSPDSAEEGYLYTYSLHPPAPGLVWGVSPHQSISIAPDGSSFSVSWIGTGLKTISCGDMTGIVGTLDVTVVPPGGSGGGTPPASLSPWTEINNEVHYDGKVGIGILNPSYWLDVNGGDVRFSNNLRMGDALINGNADRSGLLKVSKEGNQSNSGISIEHSSTSVWSVMGDQDEFRIYDEHNNDRIFDYHENAGIDLYHNNSKKLSTTLNGINVPGVITANGGNSNEWNAAYKSGDQPSFSNIYASGFIRTSRLGLQGMYNSSQVQGIWSIGTSWKVATSSNNFGNQYGIVYAHTNAGTTGTKKPIAGWGHQILFTNNGTRNAAISLTSGNGYFAGKVGIGTTNPSAKLEVDGSIVTEEIRVEVVNAPDYVFADGYERMSLEQIKKYIGTHRHLPEIPNAKTMESSGVNLGSMSMSLLKKIEELTLHQIELLEALEQQKAMIKVLSEKVRQNGRAISNGTDNH